MSDDEVILKLETCTLPADKFNHAMHLRAAWVYLNRYAPLEAAGRFSTALRAHAAAQGKGDRYHETITWAYVFLLNERIQMSECSGHWDGFVEANSDLLDWQNSILKRYYSDATLQSDFARRVFVMPDRISAEATA